MDIKEYPWPRWTDPLLGGSAAVVGVVIAVQRHAFTQPGLSTLLIVLAVLPWLLFAFRVPFPMYLCPPIVIGCVLVLLAHPVRNDFAPFLLVLGAGTTAIVTGPVFSIGVAAADAGVMLGYELAGTFYGAGIWIFGIFFAWFLGFGFRYQLKVYGELKVAQADLAEKAATDERQRVAREVHDVIAHSLTVTMLHLTGARLALQSGERDEAVEALAEAERTGRQAMNDVRRTVGLLSPSSSGGNGSTSPAAPEPSAADIADLVAAYRAAGLDVDIAVRGPLTDVSPTVGLALYRIAQESLANVAKHAPGSAAAVSVDVENGTVRLTTRNPVMGAASVGTGDYGGIGVRGMRERTELLGGSFSAGPNDGAWEVQSVVPLAASDDG